VAEQHFNNIGLVGLGLMGGSFALAAQACWPGVAVHGYDPSEVAQQWARANGSITLHASVAELALVTELIVIAAPLRQFPGIMAALLQSLGNLPRSDTIIIDLASTKASTLRHAQQSLGDLLPRFVACHPIAGSEQSGARHASAELFRDKPVVLTPDASTSAHALQSVKGLWHALGARVVTMGAEQHDELLAYLSHAPHLLAFVYMLQSRTLSDEQLALAGSGFRDFTRIAGSNPELWADILLDNRGAVIELLERQRQGMQELEQLLSHQQREPLIKVLSVARDKRASLT
jgi:prephenate dehydrogenase